MKGSCEHIEYVVGDNRQDVVLQIRRLCQVLAILTLKTYNVPKRFTSPRTWTDPWARPKQWKMDTRFGMWDVKSLYRAGSHMTVVRGLVSFRLELVGVVKVRREKRDTALAVG